ncbi:hypothetical protein TW95_gp1659 [Pandoravirus inopinatum]|uniref:Uncharacterized protein n=1 Tax=Pandoravirus inopinatum TaxID=1605721 RepID=A0A0B5IZN5_9VIRU|nr:hypothetical protein TW95_gp1659 [Pandoravirus inopinatum]AJF98393.1 hypothetical protein [Pandoravirus inopinatum]
MWVRPRATHPTPAKPTVAVDITRPGDWRAKPHRSLARTMPTAIRQIDRSGSDDDDGGNGDGVSADARQPKPAQKGLRAAAHINAKALGGPPRAKGPITHMVALSGPDASLRAARARHDRRPAPAAKAAGDRARAEPAHPTPRRPVAPRSPPHADDDGPASGHNNAASRCDGADDASTSRSDSRSHTSESDEDADDYDDDDDGYKDDDADERTGITDWGGLQAAALGRARADTTREQRRTAHALADGLVGLRGAMERAWLRSVLVPPAAVAEVEARAQAFLRAGCCCAWEPAVAPLGASLRALVAQLGIDRPQEPTPCFVALLDALVAAVRLVVASDPADLGRVSDDVVAPPISVAETPQPDHGAPKTARVKASDNSPAECAPPVQDSKDGPCGRVVVPSNDGTIVVGPTAESEDHADHRRAGDAPGRGHDVGDCNNGGDVDGGDHHDVAMH